VTAPISGPVDLNAAMLGALTGRGSFPGAAELAAQLGLTDSTDPTTAMIVQLAMQRERDALGDADDAGDAEAADEVPNVPPTHGRRASLARLERRLQAAEVELEELRVRNDAMAAAVGACYACWGDDSTCPVCAGAGVPGCFAPRRALLAQLVGPALARLRAAASRSRDDANSATRAAARPAAPELRPLDSPPPSEDESCQ
jgi:hypothetical protein